MIVNPMSFAVAAAMLIGGTANAQDRCRKVIAVKSEPIVIVDLGPGALAAVTLCAGESTRAVEVHVDGRLQLMRQWGACRLVSGRHVAVRVQAEAGTDIGVAVNYCVEEISLRP